MNKILTLAATAFLLTNCQQQPQPGNPQFAQFAQDDLALLQLGARTASAAEVYSRIETQVSGEESIKRYPLSQPELQLLKTALSKAMPAPHSTQEALQARWKSAGAEIRLMTVDGSTICAVSDNTICSYSDSLTHGKTLLCLPDAEMAILNSLPTLRQARAYKEAEDSYALHCRLRAEEAGEIRKAAERANAARVCLQTEDDTEYIYLSDLELAQLKRIFANLEPLPAMTREAWNTPTTHCMPLPPQRVYINLELLILKQVVICTIPMNYRYLAASSEADVFRHHEGEGQVAALPDDQLAVFASMPFWAKAREEQLDMCD